MLADAAKPAAIVSAHASNEELEAFQSALGDRVAVYTRQDYQPEAGEVVEDSFLIKADKNPNSFQVRALFGNQPFDAGKGHDLVLLWGDNLDYASLGGARVIHLTSFKSSQERPASVLIPISTLFERSGSFCNFEGKQNNFEKVFDKPTLVQDAGYLFGRL
jgi:NADH dehydrogenase/NADH:ubiquinone oxidoreductase subunit G